MTAIDLPNVRTVRRRLARGTLGLLASLIAVGALRRAYGRPTLGIRILRSRAIDAKALLLAVVVALGAGLVPAANAGAAPACPPEESPCGPGTPTDPKTLPPQPGTIGFSARTTKKGGPASLGLRLGIGSRTKTWVLERRLGAGWTTVRSGTVAGVFTVDVTDTGLTPDQEYCYRLESINANGTAVSPMQCAWTRDGRGFLASRVQARITTADVPGADAPDKAIRAVVNGPYPTAPPVGTWLDHGRRDFDRGDTHSYDVRTRGVSDLSDLTAFSIENTSDDDWCVSSVTILVDGKPAFRRDWGDANCQWLGTDRASTRFVFTHADLRAAPEWAAYPYEPPSPFIVETLPDGATRVTRRFLHAELEQQIEASVGDALHDKPLYWGHLHDRPVELARRTATVAGVDLDLAADVDGPDPEVDVDFDLHASATLDADKHPHLDVTLENLKVDAEYAWWQEALSLGIADLIEDKIEGKVFQGFPAVDQQSGADVPVDTFTATFSNGSDLVITAIIRPPPTS